MDRIHSGVSNNLSVCRCTTTWANLIIVGTRSHESLADFDLSQYYILSLDVVGVPPFLWLIGTAILQVHEWTCCSVLRASTRFMDPADARNQFGRSCPVARVANQQ
jgi:hypothetical protein